MKGAKKPQGARPTLNPNFILSAEYAAVGQRIARSVPCELAGVTIKNFLPG